MDCYSQLEARKANLAECLPIYSRKEKKPFVVVVLDVLSVKQIQPFSYNFQHRI